MSNDKGLGAVLEAAESVSRTEHEAAIAVAREEGRKAGYAQGVEDGQAKPADDALQAARSEGASAERTRILGIQAHGVAGTEKLVAELVADGKTTPDQAGARILGELKAQGPQMLASLKKDQPPPTGAGASAGGAGNVQADAYERGKLIALKARGRTAAA